MLFSDNGSTAQNLPTTITSESSWLKPVSIFTLAQHPLTIRRPAEPEKPFTVAGQCGAMLGQQDGKFESWIFPVKLFSEMSIEARVDGYDVPLNVNRLAAEIEVSPDHTTITWSHIAFTIKEVFFATQCPKQDGTGILALFQISSIRPLTLTFSFTPEVKRMWPAPVSGSVSPEWIAVNRGPGTTLNDTTRPGGLGAVHPAGWYMLHTDFPDLAGAIALPGAVPGILQPYQERPATYPLQFVLRFDPKSDDGHFVPLLMAVGTTPETATRQALEQRLSSLNANVSELYQQNAIYYAHFFDTRTTIETPDVSFNHYLQWAALSIDQARVRHGDEIGLVAGFFSSGSSARPGFGWFFGRDTLFTTWAINSYGDFSLTEQALSFLIRRQRDDGKMPHEYSQTAELVDWPHMPYEFAAADATPLFLMAVDDYATTSGDLEFLRANWTAIQKAWNFETTHDSDGDGIYDNVQGTGWVESWPQGMPHQEIYLAALDQQASQSMARLSKLMGQDTAARAAQERADRIASKITEEYAQPDGTYAFSRNIDGSVDKTLSIFPAIAWWGGRFALPAADAMFRQWASHSFSTDWGLRDISEQDPVYDPISYHQGSVWPLFTGWASLAEYRAGRDLAGYSHLMQNTNLTTEQDLGAVTELLSGAYYRPFGRSTSHQMWSSAMVLVPALRGLFGVSVDAPTHTITVDPHLPAQWPTATLHHIAVGDAITDLHYERKNGSMIVALLNQRTASPIRLMSSIPNAKPSGNGTTLTIPLPAIEVGMDYGAADALPSPGADTTGVKVLDQRQSGHELSLQLEAPGNSTHRLFLRRNGVAAHVTANGCGATLNRDSLDVRFPDGAGYQQCTLIISWP